MLQLCLQKLMISRFFIAEFVPKLNNGEEQHLEICTGSFLKNAPSHEPAKIREKKTRNWLVSTNTRYVFNLGVDRLLFFKMLLKVFILQWISVS